MKKVKSFLLSLMVALVLPAVAQQVPQLPLDKAVRYGKLPNGLTYYIRHNAEPKGQVNFYIAQKVGAVQEDDNQRGLAHFLEHMAFNGSKHFPADGQLIKYCESIGVKFGENLNAYTAPDETVYNIDNVPATESNIDSCLYILADWSGGLLLQADEIQKERGVIHEEWRMRSTPSQRILERQLPTLYPGSRYGHRMPIGLMEIIDNFDPPFLRAYYEKWYRPDLQGVVIVGDVNVDELEAKLRRILGEVTMPANPAKFEDYPVPTTPSPIYVIDKDKEQKMGIVMIMFKQDVLPREYRNSPVRLAVNFVNSIVTQSINARLAELAQKPDCPFIGAEVDYGNYLMSKTANAFTISVIPKPNQDEEAVRVAMAEVERAAQHGITGTEIYRAKEELMSGIEATYENREKQKHNFYTTQYVRHFLDGDAAPDLDTEFAIYKQMLPALPADEINRALRQYTAQTDTNFVVLAIYPDEAGRNVPTEAQLRSAIESARSAKLDAYVDNVKDEPLVAKLPRKGKIVKQSAAPFGYTQWTLSNGARVFFKQTDFNASQVLMSATSWGGTLKIADKDLSNSKLINGVMGSTGLGNFTSVELGKKLAGKQASVGSSVNERDETLSGSATPKDLRTLFELVYLKFQKPINDPEAYNSYVLTTRTQLENANKDPMTAFADSVRSTIYNNNPRRLPVQIADLDAANYERIKQLYAQRFNSAGDFDFFFTGAFNTDSLRAYTEQYIASLPKVAKRETMPTTVIEPRAGEHLNRFRRAMETPQANAVQLWTGKMPFTLADNAVVSAFGDILTKRYLKSIREDRGMAYSVGASANLSYGVVDNYVIQSYAPFTPSKADSLLYFLDLGVREIAASGVTEQEVDDIRQFELKEFTEAQRNNSYWQGLITAKTLWNKDLFTEREAAIRAITPAAVQRFAQQHLLRDMNRSTIMILPEKDE